MGQNKTGSFVSSFMACIHALLDWLLIGAGVVFLFMALSSIDVRFVQYGVGLLGLCLGAVGLYGRIKKHGQANTPTA